MTAIVSGAKRSGYDLAAHSELPRAVDHDLQMWGCVACNFCVTVCPNDAFFRLPTPEDAGIPGRQQYFVLAELCNECGNCLVFCPERGDPAQVKPKLYLDAERFAAADGQAFFIAATDAGLEVTPNAGHESEVPRLVELLVDGEEGFPVRHTDMIAAAGRAKPVD
jgi:putative selenate reductase